MAQNDTIVSDLIFNSMSQAEFNAQMQAETLDPNQFYLTPDTTQSQLNDKADIATVDAIRSRVTALEGYDYVVAEQKPNASNNYTWYKKYKSGWVEQGGQVAVAKQAANTILSTDVSLPIIMSNAAYLVNATFITDGGNSTGLRLTQTGRNTTHITLFTFSTTGITNDYLMSWEVKGISA
ncbi:MAG: hypothetical protein UIC65_01350 [Alphaproteobacteria bacterium]|nr:hypothetical protein [Alphaproteobacteria bacterium]